MTIVSSDGGVEASLEVDVTVVVILVSEGAGVEETSGGRCHWATTGGDKKHLHKLGEGTASALAPAQMSSNPFVAWQLR